MVPCYYGWQKLAQELHQDRETKKDTKFYKTFIETNKVENSIKKLNKTLNDQYKKWNAEGLKATWLELFRRSMQMEIALFNDALNTGPNLCPIATVPLSEGTYIFSSRDAKIVYQKVGQSDRWEDITHADEKEFSERLGSSVFSATAWNGKIRLYYINEHYVLKELCLMKDGQWKHGALTDKKWKVLPGSHLDAISTKELSVTNKDEIQIKVIFVDSHRNVWEASIEKGEWERKIIATPTAAQKQNHSKMGEGFQSNPP